MSDKPALLLLPNLLGKHKAEVSVGVENAVASLDGLIAESPQGGRSFLNRFRTKKPPYDIPLSLLNEHTKTDEMDFLLKPILEGGRWGYVTDAGLPCLADPGSQLVMRARQLGIPIEAHIGPSSLVLALMLCGLPAQRFSFHGYPFREKEARKEQFRLWEKQSYQEQATHFFIEAPYRNNAALETLLEVLNNDTWLAVGWDLSLPSQQMLCYKVASWKKSPLPKLEKKPAIFLFFKSK